MKKIYTYSLFWLVVLTGISSFGQIIAVDDTHIPDYGLTPSVINNDTLNGNQAIIGTNPGEVTLSSTPNQQLLIHSNGAISVLLGTPSGTYTIQYTICEVSNPSNCATATATVTVALATIDAVDDILTANNGITPSVITNDTLYGSPIVIGTIPGQLNLVQINFLEIFTLNPNGTITVSPNTPAGTYSVVYSICESNSPYNCDSATALVTVITPVINVVDDTFTTVNGLTPTVITNDTLNGNPATIGTNPGQVTLMPVSVPTGLTLNANGTISVAPNTQPGIYPLVYTICEVTNPSNCDTATTMVTTEDFAITDGIKFKAFLDANANGIKDINEVNFNNVQFSYQKNSEPVHSVYTNYGEGIIYEDNPGNNYSIYCYLPTNWYYCNPNYSLTIPSYSNITVPVGSGITTYNFPVTLNNTVCEDIGVGIYGWNTPRPGFTYNNRIHYRNNGNQNIAAGTVTFTKDNAVTITSTDIAVTQTPSGFTYNFTNLAPNEYRTIMVTIQVPVIPTVVLGQLLTNTVSITTPINDVNPYNNTRSVTQVIVGSYDPNEITESHGGKILHSAFTANDFLTYNIQFENTGTAAAENIKVNCILDSKLDETSIRMIDASGNYLLDRLVNNLTWKFDGINLPPSSSNSPTIGHGHITFQIKPKPGYAIGDIISNTANIYFDFNPAITTNTCTTEFVSTLNTDNFAFQDFNYFPNPAKNTLTISNASAIDTIEITSILGQKMISKKVNDLQTEINVSELSNGIYFVKITAEGVEKTIKIIKK
jgi:hypothetical protein